MKIANAIKHAAKLMASGFVAAIGFILLAKGTFFGIEQATTNTFFSLLAVQLLAVTGSVLGADRKIISILSTTNEAASINLSKSFYIWLAATTFISLILLSTHYNTSVATSLIICASIASDTISTVKQAELSAKLKTNKILASNTIRYPLFFALLLITKEISRPTIEIIFALFLATSLLRLSVIIWPEKTTTSKLKISPDIHLGSFQLLNYSINRGAQTLAGASLLSISADNQSLLFLSWKIIELIDKGVMTTIPLLLSLTLQHKKNIAISIALAVSLISSFLFVSIAATTSQLLTSLPMHYVVWLVAHSSLIYPSNILFLLTLRESGSKTTLKASALALTLSILSLTILSLLNESLLGLALFTPIGLFTMTLIMAFTHTNKKTESTNS